jgi:hypothetical protein
MEIKKFYKKPDPVEALQLTEEACWDQWLNKVPFWPNELHHISGSYSSQNHTIGDAYISLDNSAYVEPRDRQIARLTDWIIKDKYGKFSRVSEEDFEALYVSVWEG